MRKLIDIIESLKNGEEPTREELYYSVLALEALHTFACMDLRSIIEHPNGILFTPEKVMERQFDRDKKAFGKSPKEWVGWNNDPHNEDYQESRAVFKKLANKIIDKMDKG